MSPHDLIPAAAAGPRLQSWEILRMPLRDDETQWILLLRDVALFSRSLQLPLEGLHSLRY
jgi:hypothetical protein